MKHIILNHQIINTHIKALTLDHGLELKLEININIYNHVVSDNKVNNHD